MDILYCIMLILIIVLSLTAPFFSAIRELRKPQDDLPLKIDSDYSRNPFDQGNRLKEHYEKTKDEKKEEKEIVVIDGDVFHFSENIYNKPVYVTGNIKNEERLIFTILLCENDVVLDDKVTVNDWLDCRGDKLSIGRGSRLGHSCVCKGDMYLRENTYFESLFAQTIYIGEKRAESDFSVEKIIKETIIEKKDVRIEERSKVIGCIKSYRCVKISSNTKVYGDIFAEGNVEIGDNCVIKGSIFCQRDVYIGNNTVIGMRGHERSLVAQKIILSRGDIVYGNISCNAGYIRS